MWKTFELWRSGEQWEIMWHYQARANNTDTPQHTTTQHYSSIIYNLDVYSVIMSYLILFSGNLTHKINGVFKATKKKGYVFRQETPVDKIKGKGQRYHRRRHNQNC